MRKKIISFLATFIIILISMSQYSFADDIPTHGKVIFIDMNRTSMNNMLRIKSLREELENRGYIGLMNIRGDKGSDDRRSYASMGAGGRANVANEEDINFESSSKDRNIVFESVTGKKAKGINDLTINMSINENLNFGEYGSTLGSLGQSLSENELKTSILGNADIVEGGQLVKNRNLCLTAMDEYGRIPYGNVDNINKKDLSMPYGISTDYTKLVAETKEAYKNSDVVFVELGDTYRLDLYKPNLNENTYKNMKDKIEKNIDEYLKNIFSMVGENDTVYIASAFPSDLDYKNKRRLSPIIKLSGNGKGLLSSSTTRREGIVTNLDVGVDILDSFDLKNPNMVGRKYELINRDDNKEYLMDEYQKIVSISSIRSVILNGFVNVVFLSWIVAMIAILFRKHISKKHKETTYFILKELLKIGIVMPLSFMITPIMNFKTPVAISLGIIIITLTIYLISKVLIKNDLKNILFFTGLTILIMVIDSALGAYLMKGNVMSYDCIIGARYYGVGNEYQGVAIGSAIFTFAILLTYKKIPKWSVIVFSLAILITSASPIMGANVGSAISECVAFLLFILLIYDVKIDFKKVILLGIAVLLVLGVFVTIDIVSGSNSHLGMFVKDIYFNGPGEIIQTFSRKIEMNLKLAQTSAWVNILLAGIGVILVLMLTQIRYFKQLINEYPIVFKGFIASVVGCFVTLLVNDSGIVSSATAFIYVIVPMIILSINMTALKE
ncbi:MULTISPECIES: hypothetical protein [unclassified Clostridioides]|uniref:hypothetical protein n=1 Tax=unclassified Clostridioides TaxID=2635829 RepID=UPI001D128B09|nr:hypothetical protein [Clostridioides sp. ZZV14-6150]MCC0661765.1 hypothetical protein [Clostridioides sp. ZZV14-6154]MCC0720216.1 hypothetical protein [Clostridioides sp. ZZV14-6105]MCC0724325.1 hypothetical protein [Clostridioides sp. ZZV14-6104]MCC0744484.1 hypothetical protein [Clostridioides sp. ZZV14-6044]MCC0752557.1 hypothetical protein [Clostridioides sp. ZZV13-5731]